MEKKENAFVRAGIPYKEVDGIFYPVLNEASTSEVIEAGKYGRLWMKMLYETNRRSYHRKMLSGTLVKEATKKNEEAYKLLDTKMKMALENAGKVSEAIKHSTMQMLKLRNQVLMEAEEAIREWFRTDLAEC